MTRTALPEPALDDAGSDPIESSDSTGRARRDDRWRSSRARVRGAASRLALGLFVVLLVLQFVTMIGNTAVTDTPRGRSSFSRDATGLAALAALYDDYGIDVDQARGALVEAPDPEAAVLLVDPPELTDADATKLVAFVADGGRLVTGAPAPDYLGRISRRPPSWAPASRDRWDAHALDPALGEVLTGNEGEWREAGAGRAVVGAGSRSLLVVDAVGRGEIWFLADTTVLTNELLTEADNAAFAIALAGGRDSVVFVEGVHGAERGGGLGALPDRWKAALAGVALAGLLFMWARGTRFGPPEPAMREFDPPRVAYVHALAASLVRTRDQRSALEHLQHESTPTLSQPDSPQPDSPQPDSPQPDSPQREEHRP